MASEMRQVIYIALGVALLLCLFHIDVEAQCSMCRAVVGSNIHGGETSRGLGLNNAILYIMAAPYLLLAVLAWVFWGDKLRAKKSDQ